MQKILILFLTMISITTLSYAQTSKNFDTKVEQYTIANVNKNQATINIDNLRIGQSGIIVHNYNSKHSVIVGVAIVKSSLDNNSTLELLKLNLLKQDAIPNSSLKPQNGDTFILNHLYNSSLLIVPNHDVSKTIKKLYPKQNFFNPDIFASYLKIMTSPVPTKEMMLEFCKNNNIGTIFIWVKNNLHIVDTNSFKIIYTEQLNTDNKTTQSPFFTKVKDIKIGFWDFGEEEIKDYNEFYSKFLGI